MTNNINIGLWCNGNTTDSGPVFLGSNPSSPTTKNIISKIKETVHWVMV